MADPNRPACRNCTHKPDQHDTRAGCTATTLSRQHHCGCTWNGRS